MINTNYTGTESSVKVKVFHLNGAPKLIIDTDEVSTWKDVYETLHDVFGIHKEDVLYIEDGVMSEHDYVNLGEWDG